MASHKSTRGANLLPVALFSAPARAQALPRQRVTGTALWTAVRPGKQERNSGTGLSRVLEARLP